MQVGLIIPIYNRTDITKFCLEKLKKATIRNFNIVIINDCSTEVKIVDYCNSYKHDDKTNKIYILHNDVNLGIAKTIKIGFDKLQELNCDIFINIDSDAFVNIGAFDSLLNMYRIVNQKKALYTGFNQASHSKSIISTHSIYFRKKSAGGINYLFHKSFYHIVRKALTQSIKQNFIWWDVILVDRICKKQHIPIFSTNPSVVQHIGIIGVNTDKNNFIKNKLFATDYKFDSINELFDLIKINSDYVLFLDDEY